MRTAREMLEGKKSSTVWSVGPKQTVFEALQVMADKRVGALMVMDGEDAVGIISERDYARKIALEGKSSKETAVEEIMTPGPNSMWWDPTQTMDDCMVLITAGRFATCPFSMKENSWARLHRRRGQGDNHGEGLGDRGAEQLYRREYL
jgi:CBS domain-containing protein